MKILSQWGWENFSVLVWPRFFFISCYSSIVDPLLCCPHFLPHTKLFKQKMLLPWNRTFTRMSEKLFLCISNSSKNTLTRTSSSVLFLKRFYFPPTCSSEYISPSPPVILVYCCNKVVFFFAAYIVRVSMALISNRVIHSLWTYIIFPPNTVSVISRLKSQLKSDFLLPLPDAKNSSSVHQCWSKSRTQSFGWSRKE